MVNVAKYTIHWYYGFHNPAIISYYFREKNPQISEPTHSEFLEHRLVEQRGVTKMGMLTIGMSVVLSKLIITPIEVGYKSRK